MRVLCFLLFFILQSCIGNAQTFEGTWKGSLVIQGQNLPLVFTLESNNGSWKGFMQSPAQSTAKIPISKIVVNKDSIHISVGAIGLVYNGIRFKDSISGVFRQGGFESALPLIRQSSGEIRKVLARSQVVNPPYLYDTTDVKIINKYDNVELAGTLTYPKKKGKYPAVLLLTGSGPQNRDEEIFGHQPFKVLADYLTKNGIVVLRVDDRGIGQSSGNFANSTIENFSKDAISAFDYLKKQPQVDKNKVGMIGHSEGGLIAELLAGQRLPDLSFIVLLAGPSFSIDKLMVEQLYAIGKAEGLSEESLARAKVINERNFEIVKGKLDTEEAYKQLQANMFREAVGNDNKQLDRELMAMLHPSYRYFMRIEPERYLTSIQIPVFAAFGSLDVQVPADPNMKSLEELLPKNAKHVIVNYPGLNHLFQTAKTGKVAEYAEIPETFNLKVMSDISTWINSL